MSVQFEEEVPISIGSEAENTVCLTGHDWRHLNNPWGADNPENADISHLVYTQGQIRQGAGGLGYHEIHVEESGMYQFELRRWPLEDGRPIQEGISAAEQDFYTEGVQEKNHDLYVGGKPLPFTQANIRIDAVTGACGSNDSAEGDTVFTSTTPISPSDHHATFTAKLSKGPHNLTCWFEGDNDLLRSAYYVYVRKA